MTVYRQNAQKAVMGSKKGCFRGGATHPLGIFAPFSGGFRGIGQLFEGQVEISTWEQVDFPAL